MIPGIVAGALLAGGGGTPIPDWDPTYLASGMEAWYDADAQTEADGAEIASLVDQSGNGFHFTGSAPRPVLEHNHVNGRKGIQTFARQLTHANTLLPATPTACAAFWVVKGDNDPASGGNDRAPLNNFGTGGVSHYYSDGNWYETFGTNSRRSVNPPTSWANWHIAAVTSGSNDFKMWWNGTAIINESSNTVATGTATRSLFQLFAGDFAELIILDYMPTTTERRQIEGYLAHKWGTTADLPSDHPYKTVAPKVAEVSYVSRDVSIDGDNAVIPTYAIPGTPTFTLSSGTLPAGMSLNSSTGQITGTASSAGTYANIVIEISDGNYSIESAPFTLTAVAGFRQYFQEFISSGNNFQGIATLKLIDSGSVDRALASNGSTISPVGYTENLPTYPVSKAIDGDDNTFTTSASASAGSGKGQLITMSAAHVIEKWGYRTRNDAFGATEGITSGNIKGRMTSDDPYTQLYVISEAGWGNNEYRERTI